jgi:HAD superfamily hydrolase (TIGR01509 family)
MSAILFGSISTLADTSELQRRAFNEAFTAHGLDWDWSRDDYRSMLGSNGGAQRVADFASARGQDVDAAAVHATKSEIFQKLLADQDVVPRPGVVDIVERAKNAGHKLGLVTTTSPENVAALLTALQSHIESSAFDIVVDSSKVDDPKPAPASYVYALDQLGESAQDAVAIEDNVGGVRSAVDAGITCVAFPNDNTSGSDFPGAVDTVDSLDAYRVIELAKS